MNSPGSRKIVHIDMDAFYAAVEQRDRPDLKGKPVVVAWRGQRSVVCAASYEARRYGIHSAMPALRAEKLCPDAVFLAPDFTRYRRVSQTIREIFHAHTDLVEPLSLDEAYLDVTSNKTALASATAVARAIRAEIAARTHLTASAGVAPNKFLAKIASDWRKPNGMFVIKPDDVAAFLAPLAVTKLPGVGKATAARLQQMGICAVGELLSAELRALENGFGRFGLRLYELARGIDHARVRADRPRKSISSEQTFARDLALAELTAPAIAAAERTWSQAIKSGHRGRTVNIKLKTSEFRVLTRSMTPPTHPQSQEEFVRVARELLARVNLPATTRYRLVGVGMSNFLARPESQLQSELFQQEQNLSTHPPVDGRDLTS